MQSFLSFGLENDFRLFLSIYQYEQDLYGRTGSAFEEQHPICEGLQEQILLFRIFFSISGDLQRISSSGMVFLLVCGQKACFRFPNRRVDQNGLFQGFLASFFGRKKFEIDMSRSSKLVFPRALKLL